MRAVEKYGDPVNLHLEYTKLLPILVALQDKLDDCTFDSCPEGYAELDVSQGVDYLVRAIVSLLVAYGYDGRGVT